MATWTRPLQLPCSKCLLIPAGSRKEKKHGQGYHDDTPQRIIAPMAELTSSNQFQFRFHDVEVMQIQSGWSMCNTGNAAIIPLWYKRWLCITVQRTIVSYANNLGNGVTAWSHLGAAETADSCCLVGRYCQLVALVSPGMHEPLV